MITFLKSLLEQVLTLLILFLLVALVLIILVGYIGWSGWEEGIRIIPDLLVYLSTFLLVVITWKYTQHTRDMAATMARQTEGGLLLKLNDLYAHPDTRKAIYFIQEARHELWKDSLENRYHFGQSFYEKYPPNSDGDQRRWHLVRFLYTLAVLEEKNLIDLDIVSLQFGPLKKIIDILEPIEAVRAYQNKLQDNPNAEPESVKDTKWPPLQLYDGGPGKQSRIPICWCEFKKWVDTYKERQQECRTSKIVNPFYSFMRVILKLVILLSQR